MGKERGFLEFRRKDASYRAVEQRLRDFRKVELPLTDQEIHEQAARCMDCGIPFCHSAPSACSLANLIPEFNDCVYRGRWKEALDILLSTNCLPEFTGRVCPALCEGSCVLGINKEPVNICKIELAVIEQGFRRGYITPSPPRIRRPERVAVVGSGPAGLAAANQLNRAGCTVTVYENAPKPGGLLRYGIPDFKLEKWVLNRRIDQMAKEGVFFECDVEIGTDISYRFLHERFDAVILACGAREPRDLNVPGRDLRGVHQALDFLTQQNRVVASDPPGNSERITAKGKNVVVIGGGDTGSDCIGTALRQGAKSVYQLEILPEPPIDRSETTPWPMWPLKRRDSSSHKEGGVRRWSVSTTELTGSSGEVAKLRGVEVEWVENPDSGKMTPGNISGSEFVLDADLVLLAMGFVGPGRNRMVEELGIEKSQRGFIACDERNATNIPGIFVAGDMARGPSLVLHAISSGMQTARHVLFALGAAALARPRIPPSR